MSFASSIRVMLAGNAEQYQAYLADQNKAKSAKAAEEEKTKKGKEQQAKNERQRRDLQPNHQKNPKPDSQPKRHKKPEHDSKRLESVFDDDYELTATFDPTPVLPDADESVDSSSASQPSTKDQTTQPNAPGQDDESEDRDELDSTNQPDETDEPKGSDDPSSSDGSDSSGKPNEPDESDDQLVSDDAEEETFTTGFEEEDDPQAIKLLKKNAFSTSQSDAEDGEEVMDSIDRLLQTKAFSDDPDGESEQEQEEIPETYDQLKILFLSPPRNSDDANSKPRLLPFSDMLQSFCYATLDYRRSVAHDLYAINARTGKPVLAIEAGFPESFCIGFLELFWSNVEHRIAEAESHGSKQPYKEFERSKPRKPAGQSTQSEPTKQAEQSAPSEPPKQSDGSGQSGQPKKTATSEQRKTERNNNRNRQNEGSNRARRQGSNNGSNRRNNYSKRSDHQDRSAADRHQKESEQTSYADKPTQLKKKDDAPVKKPSPSGGSSLTEQRVAPSANRGAPASSSPVPSGTSAPRTPAPSVVPPRSIHSSLRNYRL